MDCPTLYVIVTNPDRALESAFQHADDGRYQNAIELLGLNANAIGESEGIAMVLIIMLAAGKEEQATAAIHEGQETSLIPAVVTATNPPS
jgi:hypothetical protein